MLHLIGLDLNMYNGVDDCGEPCRAAQLRWLEADLKAANANREAVPWIVAFSHYPLYCSNCPLGGAPGGHEPPPRGTRRSRAKPRQASGVRPGVSADVEAWWQSEACEYSGHSPTCQDWAKDGKPTRREDSPSMLEMVPDLEPLFMKHGVDVYASGHIHDYEWLYPTYNATPVQKDFVDPRAPVHLVSGNGGPPAASYFNQTNSMPLPYSLVHGSEYSYTRITAHNASHMTWTQIANEDSRVLAELIVTQSKHGEFPIPAGATPPALGPRKAKWTH